MNRLNDEDRDWFIIFLQNQIQEEETNAWRYRTKEQYERVAKLKKVYNILSYDNRLTLLFRIAITAAKPVVRVTYARAFSRALTEF